MRSCARSSSLDMSFRARNSSGGTFLAFACSSVSDRVVSFFQDYISSSDGKIDLFVFVQNRSIHRPFLRSALRLSVRSPPFDYPGSDILSRCDFATAFCTSTLLTLCTSMLCSDKFCQAHGGDVRFGLCGTC